MQSYKNHPQMSKRDSYTDRTRHLVFAKNADETEAIAFIHGSAHLESGVRDELIADALDDFGPGDIGGPGGAIMERFQADDLTLDEAAGSTSEEIQDRLEILGNLYPFYLNGNTLEYAPSENGIYELLLAISSVPSPSTHNADRLFEEAATQIARGILGDDSLSWHTGWPRSGGNPPRLKDLYQVIHEQTGEFHWQPKAGFPDDPAPADEKDCGIDIIVQRPLDAARQGNLFLFGQCACGNNWDSKLLEADPSYRLSRYFSTITHVPPIVAIFVPFCLSQYWINDTSRQKVLPVDRLRLVQIAAKVESALPEWLSRDRNINQAIRLLS